MAIVVTPTYTDTPGRSTLAEMIEQVLSWVQGDSTDDQLRQQAINAINGKILELNTWNWKRLTRKYRFVIGPGYEYRLPPDFRDPQHLSRVEVKDDGSDFLCGSLHYEDPQAFKKYFEGSYHNSGYPFYYTVDLGRWMLILNRVPDESYISKYPWLELNYYRKLNKLVNPQETLDAPTEWELVIIRAAQEEMSGKYAPSLYRVALQRRVEAEQNLRIGDNEILPDSSGGYFGGFVY